MKPTPAFLIDLAKSLGSDSPLPASDWKTDDSQFRSLLEELSKVDTFGVRFSGREYSRFASVRTDTLTTQFDIIVPGQYELTLETDLVLWSGRLLASELFFPVESLAAGTEEIGNFRRRDSLVGDAGSLYVYPGREYGIVEVQFEL